MAPHLQLLTRIDIDLTDEQGLLAEDLAERDPQESRARLAALNLQPAGAAASDARTERFGFAVYKATGDRRIASLFG